MERLRSTSGEQLAKEVDFFGVTKGPSISFWGWPTTTASIAAGN